MLAEVLALLALAASVPVTGAQSWTLQDTKVVVSAESPWPDALNKGWWPLQVTLENGDERRRRVTLSAEGWQVPRESFAAIELEPGERTSLELLVPAFVGQQNSVYLRAEVDGAREVLGTGIGPSGSAGPSIQAVLVLARELPPAGSAESWTAQLSNLDSEPELTSGSGASAIGTAIRHGLRTAAGASGTAAAADVLVQAARLDQMPARSEAYSSLDVVVLDSSQGLPEAQRLAPLIAWARLGGTLVVVGPRAGELARAVPEFSLWMEPRFACAERWRGLGDLPASTQAWRFGLGSFATLDEAALSSESQRALLRSLSLMIRGVVDDPAGSRMTRMRPVIPDLFNLPLKAFALSLIAFAVLIGPVNFLLVKRWRRPALLLLTIPLIALVVGLGLLTVGILAQGLGVKLASRTLAVLDQREHRVSSAEMRMTFAGLAPAAGLVPRAGSSCYFIATYSGHGTFEGPSYSSRTMRVDQSDGFVLSGGFMPAREAFVEQVLAEHAERGRLAIRANGGKYSVENGLGATVYRLLLRDANGAYHSLGAALEIDASAELVPLESAAAELFRRELAPDALCPELGELPPASYLAELSSSPFSDDCGVKGVEQLGKHALFGVLALDAEEWK